MEVEYDKIPYSKVECSEHLLIAHKAALESIVLLKNENGILPLKENEIKTLALSDLMQTAGQL